MGKGSIAIFIFTLPGSLLLISPRSSVDKRSAADLVMTYNGRFDYDAAIAHARSTVAKAQADGSLATLDFAQRLDLQDELVGFRSEFHIPPPPVTAQKEGETESTADSSTLTGTPLSERGRSIYLCGNSLGCQPRGLEGAIARELRKWREEGVEGHFLGQYPWVTIDEICVDSMARIVGAKPCEVAVMNSLTTNLHLVRKRML